MLKTILTKLNFRGYFEIPPCRRQPNARKGWFRPRGATAEPPPWRRQWGLRPWQQQGGLRSSTKVGNQGSDNDRGDSGHGDDSREEIEQSDDKGGPPA